MFLYPDGRLWRSALIAIYSILSLFLAIFAMARLRWEKRFPVLAVAGILVCLFAVAVLVF